MIKHSEEHVGDSGISIENNEFSNQLCGSERVILLLSILLNFSHKSAALACAWTLDLASVKKIQAMEKLGVKRSRQTLGKKQVLGGSVVGKPGIMFVRSSGVEQNVKRKPGLDLKNCPKTVSLEQVKALVRELEQEDISDMEVDLAEVRWQESDNEVLNAFAQDLETTLECLPAEEDEDADVDMRDDEHRDGSDVEEQAPMEEGEEHDEVAPEGGSSLKR